MLNRRKSVKKYVDQLSNQHFENKQTKYQDLYTPTITLLIRA